MSQQLDEMMDKIIKTVPLRISVRMLGIDILVREAIGTELPPEEAGVCRIADGLILYDSAMHRTEIRETILHELIHYFDIKLNGNDSLEEEQVSMISNMLFTLFRDNRHLVETLFYD
jgi:hypothetical protein